MIEIPNVKYRIGIASTDDSLCPTCGEILKNKGEVKVDLDINIAILDGVYFRLTGRQATILHCLAKAIPRTVSTGFIMDSIYGLESETDEPDQHIISVFVCRLRNKIKKSNYKVETVWGKGFRLVRKEQKSETSNN